MADPTDEATELDEAQRDAAEDTAGGEQESGAGYGNNAGQAEQDHKDDKH